MKSWRFVLWGFWVLSLVACGRKDSIDKVQEAIANSPTPTPPAREVNETNLAVLMANHAKHVVTPQPWVGYWWPYTGAGIGSTWRDPSGMSPADKYDIAYRAYLDSKGIATADYKSLASWERIYHGAGIANLEAWWGHCNGWAASSVMLPEPRDTKFVNGVTFEVRDQKALLAESWLEFVDDFIGTRVNDKTDFESAAFWDVTPAQFTLVLANVVGAQNRGIIFDRHTGYEIWNQPMVAYSFDAVHPDDYLGQSPMFPDVYRVNMTARIWWANDNVGPDDVTPPFNMDALFDQEWDYFYPGRKLRFELWLDGPVEFDALGNMVKSGQILSAREDSHYVGGVWKNGNNPAFLINTHPDYMWIPFGVKHSTGYKNPRIDDAWIRENISPPLVHSS